MAKIVKKRRPRGQAAIGDINATKVVATSMIADELKLLLEKTQRLRDLRLAASDSESKREL